MMYRSPDKKIMGDRYKINNCMKDDEFDIKFYGSEF